MNHPTFFENITACDQCDLLHDVPPLKEGERYKCQRCGHVLVTVHEQASGRILAISLSSLLMFFLSFSFSFLGFSSNGAERTVSLFELASVLIAEGYLVLSIIISLALFVFPLVYLSAIVFVLWSFHNHHISLPLKRTIIHWVVVVQPWLMVDVFLVGALVALVKMMSLADIEFGLSFWALCAHGLLLVRTVSLLDRRWLWNKALGQGPEHDVAGMEVTAQQTSRIGCHFCGAVHNQTEQHCSRCGHSIHSRHPRGLLGTMAFLIGAVIMFVPANVFPIMQTTFLGGTEPSTIMGGVFLLWSLGSYPVALVIFFASVVIPLAKMLSLSWLCWQFYFPSQRHIKQKIWLYRLTEVVGRWSMIDVFVIAVLTSLVQLGNLITILPGAAVLSFAAVVVLTMLAAMMFDPRLLWDKESVMPYAENKEC